MFKICNGKTYFYEAKGCNYLWPHKNIFTIANFNRLKLFLYVLLHGWKHFLLQSISINFSLKCSEIDKQVCIQSFWLATRSTAANQRLTLQNFVNYELLNFATNFRSSEHFSEK